MLEELQQNEFDLDAMKLIDNMQSRNEQTQHARDTIEEQAELNNINVIVAKDRYKADTKNEFVIMFYESFEEIIINYNLSKLDIRVLLRLLRKMEQGNLLSFKQSALADEIETSQANVSRTIKRLKGSKIIVENKHGEQFINPQVISKMNLQKMKSKEAYELSRGTFNNF